MTAPHPRISTATATDPLERPLLAASLSGYGAYFVWTLMAAQVPAQLDRLRADVAAGRKHSSYLREARRTWAAIQAATDQWLTWHSAVNGTTATTPPAPPAPSVTITTREAAAMLGVKERRVRQLLAERRLIGQQAGRVWLVDRASVELLAATRSAA